MVVNIGVDGWEGIYYRCWLCRLYKREMSMPARFEM
jgi:hypothetical protein